MSNATNVAITADSSGLAALAPRLADDAPLSWLLASMDVAATGLRRETNNSPLLRALLKAREIGAVSAFGINTVLTDGNLPEVCALGLDLVRSGVDQFSVGPMLRPENGRMTITTEPALLRRLVEALAEDAFDGQCQFPYRLEHRSYSRYPQPEC